MNRLKLVLLTIIIISALYLLLPRYNLYDNAIVVKTDIDLNECLKLRKLHQQCIKIKDKRGKTNVDI